MLTRSRPRRNRNRFVQIGLFIIVYTCYYALSASINPESESIPEAIVESSTNAYTTEKYEVKALFYLCLSGLM